MLKLIRKLLGITDLEQKLDAVIKHSNIKLEKSKGYTVKDGKGQMGFKAK